LIEMYGESPRRWRVNRRHRCSEHRPVDGRAKRLRTCCTNRYPRGSTPMKNRSSDGHHRFTFQDDTRRIEWSRAQMGDATCIRWYLDDTALSDAFITSLPRELAALEDVAGAVSLADRLARRPSANRGEHEDGWAREFDLQIPVADLAR
jgi:hypothetical protein